MQRISSVLLNAMACGAFIDAGTSQAHADMVQISDRLDAEPIASLTVLWAPGIDGRDDPTDRGSEAALAEIELGGRAAYILDNGAEIGGQLVWRAQRDHPNRPGGAGSPIPGVGDAVGAFSGLSNGAANGDVGARGSLETAFIFIRGGYGEFSYGRDTGVAARFQEGDVDVFSHARVSDARLDLTGLGVVNTRANLTGPAEKLSYTTPRLLGIRAGASFTPVADRTGLDRNPVSGADGLVRPEIQSAVEVGLNASRRLRDSGVRIRAGLGYATATLEASPAVPLTASDSVDVWSAGAEISRGRFSTGFSTLVSDDGLKNGDYRAWTGGLAYTDAAWTASLTFGQAEADSAQVEATTVSIGVARELEKFGTLTIGYQSVDAENATNAARSGADRGGIVIELSLSL
ncbi:MAG: porin [Pseudomonadota bacterium]